LKYFCKMSYDVLHSVPLLLSDAENRNAQNRCIYEYDVVLQRHKIFSYIENAIDLVGSKLFG
jgi:hypothetical protein